MSSSKIELHMKIESMDFSSDSEDSFDHDELTASRWSIKSVDAFQYTTFHNYPSYMTPMQVSELLKKFKGNENEEDGNTGRVSCLSIPSSSSTRRSFANCSPVLSSGPSRIGTGRTTRLRFPIEVDVKSQEQWDELLAKEGLIVVDAYAGWCGPCKAIESTFRRIRNETGDDLLHFAIAETDNIDSLALYREKSRPTFLFYGGGELVHVIRGCDAPGLTRSITHFLKEEHKILNGDGERKQFVDIEVQEQEDIAEEKRDDEKSLEVNEDEEIAADVFEKFKVADSNPDVVEVPKEISVAIIKPDAVQDGHADAIIKNIEESGIEILHKEEKVLSKEEAAEFYKQHEGSDHFEQLIEFMSSGPVLTLVLSKRGDDAGYGLIPEVRDLIGPKDVNLAREEAPDSIRAQYGTDAIKNAVHACDSADNAARELAFFFPDFNVPTVQEKRKRKRIQRTLALIRPDAYMQRKESILEKVKEAGFTIAMSKEMQLTREQAEDFYSEHKEKDYFESLINNMCSGPALALCLAREDAVETWRNVLGPKDVSEAKETAPDSLRAMFASDDATMNPIHGAESIEAAEKELQKIFPLQSTLAVIKPEAYSVPEQREQIVEKIEQSGFRISAQKEINLTKELASQFYKEHEGKDFFDGLTDYMSSGPTLFLILSKEDAVSGFRALVGPTEPDLAKEQAPDSLRALYATDSMKNAIHSSSNVEKAKAAIEQFFPELELNADGTVKEEKPEEISANGADSEDKPLEEGQLAKSSEDDDGDTQETQKVADEPTVSGESEEAISNSVDRNQTADDTGSDDVASDGAAPVDAENTENLTQATNDQEGSKNEEENNNEVVNEKPEGIDQDEPNKQIDNETEKEKDGENEEQINTTNSPEESKNDENPNEKSVNETETNNVETDNNGTEENNNEDVNIESKPDNAEITDTSEQLSNEEPDKQEASDDTQVKTTTENDSSPEVNAQQNGGEEETSNEQSKEPEAETTQ